MTRREAYTHAVELRTDSTATGNHLLSGYAIVWNTDSENMGFIEQVAPTALEGTNLDGVFALFNHSFDNVLGKVGSNLTLKTDDKGLYFELELLPSDEHVFELVQQGIINKMSFGFIVETGGDTWTDSTHRTINNISELLEISLVPMPAYQSTDITAVRSVDMAENTDQATEAQAPQAGDTEAPETIKDILAQIAQLQAALQALQDGDTEQNDGSADDSEDRDDLPEPAEPDSVDETRSIKIGKGSQNMTQAKVVSQTPEEVRNFNQYLTSGEKRALDTVSGTPIIPKELLDPQFQPEASTGVLSLINTQTTTTNVGSLPIVKHATAGLSKATEGANTANVDAPSIVSVDYHLNLFSGEIPLTYELAKSSKNASAIVLKHITAMRDLTRVNQVGALLKQATAVTINSIDDLKAQANADALSDYGDKAFIVTSDFYNWLDQQKTANGEYLLQPTLVEGAQKTLLGYPLYQVKNSVLGGTKSAFFGSAHDFALEVINDNMIFSYQEQRDLTTRAVGGVFADWQVADKEAGVILTVAEGK